MALARVVTFDGVSKDRMQQMERDMDEGQPPEGFPASEMIALHDPDAEKSLVILVFDSEDDYKTADDMLNAMPAGDTLEQIPDQIAFGINHCDSAPGFDVA